jgi:predicted RNA-binding Zn ribbon-like protein
MPLHPGDYRGTYKLIAGRPSLDFVNTVSWPDTERSHDWLDSVGNVRLWLRAVGLRTIDFTQADLGVIGSLRATLTSVLRPLANGHRPTKVDFNRLNERILAANTRRVIDRSTLAWTWKLPETAADPFGPVLLDAADLITGRRRDRLRHCPSCDWLFEDQTRNGLRRWCDMADCGSRDKASRYYYRSKH